MDVRNPERPALSFCEYYLQKFALRICFFLLAAQVAPCFSQELAPDVLIKTVAAEVTAIIRQDKEMQAGDPAKLLGLVTTKIVPYFDFDRMTEIAVARNWHLATAEQKRVLAGEFKTLLVRTYSTALSGYRDQVVEFPRLHAAPGDEAVIVKSVMKRPGKEALTMDYDMEKLSGRWRVYDITIDGVSLVSTYRETFSDQVREGGISRLIASLEKKNRQSDASFRFPQTESISVHSILRGFLQGAR
jgi:phospholipid transport system substrate-binding protein